MTTPGLIYMDGFSHYGAQTTHMLEELAYVQIDSGYSITTPVWDGSSQLALTCQTDLNAQVCRRTLPATKTGLLTNFRFATDTLADLDIYDWRDGSNIVICKLSLNTNGSVSLKLADNTVLGTTASLLQYARLWQFYEMKLDCSAKTFELHVDDLYGTDTPVLTLTGLGISAGPIASTGQLPLAVTGVPTDNVYMKDLIVRNPSGSINNGFIGSYLISTDFPDADGTVAWTPFYNGGPALGSYSTINRPNPTDLTYISASSSSMPISSNFDMGTLAVDTTIISGMMLIQRSFKADANHAQIQTSLVGPSGGVTSGTLHTISQNPIYYNDIVEYDPDTSGRISPLTIINGQIRVTRVS